MRITAELSDLSRTEWILAQGKIRTSYEFPPGVARVCLTLRHEEEERHAEVPLSVYAGLLMAFILRPSLERLKLAVSNHGSAMAVDTTGPQQREEWAEPPPRPWHPSGPGRNLTGPSHPEMGGC
jgi:hypothetical protein